MLTTIVHHTIVSDTYNDREENKRHFINLVKKIRKEIGEKPSRTKRTVKQLLPTQRLPRPIVAVESNEKSQYPGIDLIDRVPGLRATEKHKVNSWDLLEGNSKNPAPLSWAWFGAVRMERRQMKYEKSYQALKYHTHNLTKSRSYFYEPLQAGDMNYCVQQNVGIVNQTMNMNNMNNISMNNLNQLNNLGLNLNLNNLNIDLMSGQPVSSSNSIVFLSFLSIKTSIYIFFQDISLLEDPSLLEQDTNFAMGAQSQGKGGKRVKKTKQNAQMGGQMQDQQLQQQLQQIQQYLQPNQQFPFMMQQNQQNAQNQSNQQQQAQQQQQQQQQVPQQQQQQLQSQETMQQQLNQQVPNQNQMQQNQPNQNVQSQQPPQQQQMQTNAMQMQMNMQVKLYFRYFDREFDFKIKSFCFFINRINRQTICNNNYNNCQETK